MKRPYNTVFLAIVACLLWSTAFAGVKIGLEYTSPLRFAGLRFLIAGAMILPFTGSMKEYREAVRSHPRVILMVAFLNTFFQYSMFYLGIRLVPAALGAIIIGSGPLFVAMIAHFVMPDEKMNRRKLIAYFAGVGGIVLVSLGRNTFTRGDEVGMTGLVLLLLVNLASRFGNVIVSRDAKPVPPMVLSSFSMIVGGLALFLVSVPFEGIHFSIKPAEYYFALVWLSFLSAAAISIWFTLLRRPGVKVSDLNFWKFLIPVAGALLAWILLPDEGPSVLALCGMALIATALVLLNIARRNNGMHAKLP